MRIYNMVEFQNKELKKRTRIIKVFPGKESLLRVASAMLIELDEKCRLTARRISEFKTNEPPNLQKIGNVTSLDMFCVLACCGTAGGRPRMRSTPARCYLPEFVPMQT